MSTIEFTSPPLPPGLDKHHLVVLEECHCALPQFSFPYTYKGYYNTSPSQVAERIRDATILITTVVPVLPSDLESAPHLQCMAIMATGMGWLDRPAFAARGISVLNCPQSNIPAVSEHWLGLYFASRKRVVEMHRLTTESNEWAREGTLTKRWNAGPPLSCGQEILGIVGYGSLGKRIEGLAKAVGFGEVLIAERKGYSELQPRKGRVGFKETLEKCTVLVLCCPMEPETINLINEPELKLMRKDTCVINMARGGIVNEAALVRALREDWISCAATDVLEMEPAGMGSSPLLPRLDLGEEPVPNLTISPHVSWFSVLTVQTLQRLLKEDLDGFLEGRLPLASVAVHDGKVYK